MTSCDAGLMVLRQAIFELQRGGCSGSNIVDSAFADINKLRYLNYLNETINKNNIIPHFFAI